MVDLSNWEFLPTTQQLADLNARRVAFGLPQVKDVRTIKVWLACCAETSEAWWEIYDDVQSEPTRDGGGPRR